MLPDILFSRSEEASLLSNPKPPRRNIDPHQTGSFPGHNMASYKSFHFQFYQMPGPEIDRQNGLPENQSNGLIRKASILLPGFFKKFSGI
jgi:hypothetical protein